MDERFFPTWYQRYEDKRFPVRITEQENALLVAPHLHTDCVEYILISHGSATAQIGAERLLLHAGDIAYIPEYTMHRVDAEEKGSRLIGLCFDISILEAPYGTMLAFLLRNLCGETAPVYRADTELARQMTVLIRHIFEEYSQRPPGYEWSIYADIYRVSTLLLRDLAVRQNVQISEVMRGVQRLLPALERIEKCYAEPLTVSGLAAELGLSEDHFSRRFREIMLQSPVTYINNLRIRRSLPHLAERVLSVSEIADKVGFSSPSYFNRVFHSVMGMSPMQYRKGASPRLCPASR